MIDGVKYLKLSPDQDLKKPSIVVTAPTANAAYIIGGRTIDSALGFNPTDRHTYVPADPAHLATLRFLFEEARVFVIDEVTWLKYLCFSMIFVLIDKHGW